MKLLKFPLVVPDVQYKSLCIIGPHIILGGTNGHVEVWKHDLLNKAAFVPDDIPNMAPLFRGVISNTTQPVITPSVSDILFLGGDAKNLFLGTNNNAICYRPWLKSMIHNAAETKEEFFKVEPSSKLLDMKYDKTLSIVYILTSKRIDSSRSEESIYLFSSKTLQKLSELKLEDTSNAISLVIDSLGKFVSILYSDHSVGYYKVNSKGLIKLLSKSKDQFDAQNTHNNITMNPQGNLFPIFNKIENSDGSFVRKIQLLDRNEDFAVKHTLSLPASINNIVLKFSPAVYEKTNKKGIRSIYNLLATSSDIDGTMIIWNTKRFKPLFSAISLCPSPLNDIIWTDDGLTLFAVSDFGYLYTFAFEKNDLGSTSTEIDLDILKKKNKKLPFTSTRLQKPSTPTQVAENNKQSIQLETISEGNSPSKSNLNVEDKNVKNINNIEQKDIVTNTTEKKSRVAPESKLETLPVNPSPPSLIDRSKDIPKPASNSNHNSNPLSKTLTEKDATTESKPSTDVISQVNQKESTNNVVVVKDSIKPLKNDKLEKSKTASTTTTASKNKKSASKSDINLPKQTNQKAKPTSISPQKSKATEPKPTKTKPTVASDLQAKTVKTVKKIQPIKLESSSKTGNSTTTENSKTLDKDKEPSTHKTIPKTKASKSKPNNVAKPNGTATSEFNPPSYQVPKDLKRKPKNETDGITSPVKKQKRDLEPIDFLDTSLVFPGTSFSRIRLATPRIKMNIQYSPPNDNQYLLEVKNGLGNEHKPTIVSLTYKKSATQLFQDFIPKHITLCTSGESFWACCTYDGIIYVYSDTGKKLLPPMILGVPCSFLEACSDFLLCVTSLGQLYCWNIKEKKLHFPINSVYSLLNPALRYSDDVLTRAENITLCGVTKNGVPLVTLSDGDGYMFDKNMETWLLVSDSWWAYGSQYWDMSNSVTLSSDGSHNDDVQRKESTKSLTADLLNSMKDNHESIVSYFETKTNNELQRKGRIKNLQRLFRTILIKEGFETIEEAITLAHLENKLLISLRLEENEEFSKLLILYCYRLSDLGYTDRLEEVLQWLFDDGKYAKSMLAGKTREEHLKNIILACSDIRHIQRVTTSYATALGLVSDIL
ncbi:hypothetical protein TBLA_0A09580 [Henningerozyma blattae CBS 6284]|uniref:Protein HIR n=1 Tax=Henningerozyma blattae (strain ATCC 34711 / CBS 6284 / DSM 70876 / NBRC 10599 / NRRL Y-10934 / UCD 77-7) TaxID=1071380 RepID=I2GX90_HENB6|nr:hypothetical protein TBLA_0A09580 [Tetrapisispora blattae CBS 6284]CCH58742.1 hypothetical protein TBLA_0A09580 [Tetrapisispora blattae CBS 6284]